MIQVLRLSSTWDKVQAPLQAWISRVVGEFNAQERFRLVTFTYVEGISPDPFPVAEAGRPRAMWLGRLVFSAQPSAPISGGSFSWANADSGAVITFQGTLTPGSPHEVTLCVVD